jgi:hypothetical protein
MLISIHLKGFLEIGSPIFRRIVASTILLPMSAKGKHDDSSLNALSLSLFLSWSGTLPIHKMV